MARFFLILVTVFSVTLLVPQAWAQAPTGPAPAASQEAAEQPADAETEAASTAEKIEVGSEIPHLGQAIERVQKQLDRPDIAPSLYDDLRSTVLDIQSQLAAIRPALVSEVDRIRKLVDALGPAPKEGEPPESAEIAAQRRQLNDRLAQVDGRLKQLDLLVEKSRGLLTSISTAQSIAIGDRLLRRTPSLFSSETWSASVDDISYLTARAWRDISLWQASPRVRDASLGSFALPLAAVILAAVAGWFLRRWLVRNFGRNSAIAEPTYGMRVRAALAEATARTAIPIIVTVVAYAALNAGGFLFELPGRIAFGVAVAIVILSILYGLPRAMLSPRIPQWRLAAIGGRAAGLWCRYALILAVVVAVDTMLITPASELYPSRNLQTTYNFLINSAYAVIFLLFAVDKRLWLTPEEEAYEQPSGTVGTALLRPPSRSKLWMVARVVVAIIAIAIPVSAIAGYGVLSDFIARRMLATAGVFLIAIVLHGLARDLVAVFTRSSDSRGRQLEELSPLYVWSVLFLDIGLALSMVFVIVPLWGGQWNRLLERLGWSLSGFRVGGYVFSITDVLAGMVTFVIALALVRFLQHFIRRRILQHTRMDSGVRDSLTTVIGYAGLVVAVVIAVTTAGFDLSGLALVAGALSVGIGFGLQSIVNNFVSGLILLAERPIKIGDWVQVGGNEGIVNRISVRSTEIKTFEQASVIVPNSELISTSVINWVHRDKTGRVNIHIGVAYDSDVEQVRDILMQCAAENANLLETPGPYVLFADFGSDALMFELRGYVADVNNRIFVSSDLRFAIEKAFREAGITIPFPQRDLHIRDSDGLARLTAVQSAARPKTPARRRTARTGKPASTGTQGTDDTDND